MENLKRKTGISKREFMYHINGGLREVIKIMKRYPEEPQFKKAIFKFSTEKEITSSFGVKFILGFERGNTKKYSSVDSVTIVPNNKKSVTPIRYQPVNFDWKETGLNLQLEFAGYIIRRISDYILSQRPWNDFKNSEFTIGDTFAITKTKGGSLGLKFFDETVDLEAKIGSSTTVKHSFSIVFEASDSNEKTKKA